MQRKSNAMKQSMKQSNTREQVELENPQGGNKSDIGPTMSGSDILVAALEREAVDTIFAYPGGASMELHQALTRSDQIRVILPRHEQGGSFAAEGYARASGKPGVCMANQWAWCDQPGHGYCRCIHGFHSIDCHYRASASGHDW